MSSRLELGKRVERQAPLRIARGSAIRLETERDSAPDGVKKGLMDETRHDNRMLLGLHRTGDEALAWESLVTSSR